MRALIVSVEVVSSDSGLVSCITARFRISKVVSVTRDDHTQLQIARITCPWNTSQHVKIKHVQIKVKSLIAQSIVSIILDIFTSVKNNNVSDNLY